MDAKEMENYIKILQLEVRLLRKMVLVLAKDVVALQSVCPEAE